MTEGMKKGHVDPQKEHGKDDKGHKNDKGNGNGGVYPPGKSHAFTWTRK